MVEFTPFRAGHLQTLLVQPAQKLEYRSLVASGEAQALEAFTSLTAWHQSRCLGCAGLIPIRPHRAVAWALLSGAAQPFMLPIVRKIKRVIAVTDYKRVELTVVEGHTEGVRFAKLIGAVQETPKPMRFYGSTGASEYMFAVLKG